jgi:hypothetical protein
VEGAEANNYRVARIGFSMNADSSDRWPVFVTKMVAIARWTDADKKRRVYLISRSDGMFTYCSEHFSDGLDEMRWIVDDKRGASFFDREETALREICSRFSWCGEVPREDR